jgi:hypothetical protein
LTAAGRFGDGFSALGIAAVAFAAAGRFEAVAAASFNCFDGAVCDAFGRGLAICLFASLPDLFAVGRRVFEGGVFADATG